MPCVWCKRDDTRGVTSHVLARCVGGPRNGDLCNLDVESTDARGMKAIAACGGRLLAERYRLIGMRTTTGERILVYIGEPPER